LGSPGDRYARTRHNIGYEVANALAARWELPRAKTRYAGLYTEGRAGPGRPRVGVLLPQTFMNESGGSAGPARGTLGVPLDRIVAVHDEIDLPFGEVRVKRGGGVAGHNGLRDIKRALGTPEFWRVRLGIGHPGHKDRVTGHVLGNFAKADAPWVEALLDAVADAAPLLAAGDDAGFMNRVALLTQPPKAERPAKAVDAGNA